MADNNETTDEQHRITTSDETEIEDHVRKKVQTFEPKAGSHEWAEQVERLVDAVVEEFAPNDPQQQSKLSEWVRAIATDEADA